MKLLQLALGLHALVVVRDLLTDTQILRGDLQQLVLCQELQAALQAQLADGDQAQSVVGAGRTGVGQVLGLTTSQRVYGTVMENIEGRGPCYLRTEGISDAQDESLKKAYLNMAPSQTLKWIESGKNPSEQNVEIEGTEPYIVGGHTASGYWVDTNRETTIRGLFAAGDVAGGCPQKYVTGALVEGEIAALRMVEQLDADEADKVVTGNLEDVNTDTANGKNIVEIKNDTEAA